jgi:glycyl-tRNA synthetase beta chain
MIPRASAELKQNLEKYLTAANILDGEVRVVSGPRRLAAMARVHPQQLDSEKEVMGPPKSAAFDNVGAPTRAVIGFAEKFSMQPSDLFVLVTARGEYMVARQKIPGRRADEILPGVIQQSILQITFPRSMMWSGSDGARFIRPIRWLVALLNGKPLVVELAGVRAGKNSIGHRFLGQKHVRISGSQDYAEKLRKNFVIASPAERLAKIEGEIRALLSRRGWRVHPDKGLLELVVYLNEYPTVFMGDFVESYLELPDEILITVMRGHQKYFAVEDSHGRLMPHFLAVMNIDRDLDGLIRAGHERVLRARFADARFFWGADQKVSLADFLPRLARVTFESRLGSYGDKVDRIRYLAGWIAEQWFNSGIPQARVTAVVRAAELAKCDLVTDMVREFTELQGIMGGLYARAQGEDDDVAWAIYDHYRPVGLDEPLPRNLTGCIVAMADKLDSMAACFAVGAIPTGSSDPFALRRSALGVVRIILETGLPFSISTAISAAARALQQFSPKRALTTEIQKQLAEFILERARFVLRERRGFAYDEINAAFAAGADDLVDAAKRVTALHEIRQTPNFMPLAVAFKRIRKILEKAGIDQEANGRIVPVKTELFEEAAERELLSIAGDVAARAADYRRSGNYRDALKAIAELRPAVDRFFDQVMVMAEDESVRKNRLALLSTLLREFSTIADFSEMVTEDVR